MTFTVISGNKAETVKARNGKKQNVADGAIEMLEQDGSDAVEQIIICVRRRGGVAYYYNGVTDAEKVLLLERVKDRIVKRLNG